MVLDIQLILIFILLGGSVGILAGLFGVGGGGILVPVFTTVFLSYGVDTQNVVHMALGSSMACIVGTSFVSLRAHHAKGGVRWDIFKNIAIGVVAGTFLATFISSYLSSSVLAVIFTIFMTYVALQLFLDIKPKSIRELPSAPKQVGAGTFIGAISALVSIGGGAMSVPYLLWHNIEMKKAIGTSAAIGFPIAISGTIGFMLNGWHETNLSNYQLGFVYLPAVLFVTLASSFTVKYGVMIAHKLPVKILKKLFGLLALSLSLKMLFSVL